MRISAPTLSNTLSIMGAANSTNIDDYLETYSDIDDVQEVIAPITGIGIASSDYAAHTRKLINLATSGRRARRRGPDRE